MSNNIIHNLVKKKLINPPVFVYKQLMYLTIMGSVAYGVSNDNSDCDIYGFCIPPKDMVFPHLRGEIPGFGTQHNRFKNWQQHHIIDKESRKEYDFDIYSIIRYFQLCMENNPNMIDSLFTPRRCVLFSSKVFEILRDHRQEFLHKGSWHKFKGYAFSQLHKMRTKAAKRFVKYCEIHNFELDLSIDDLNGKIYESGLYSHKILQEGITIIKELDKGGNRTKRLTSIKEFGFDPKFAYHIVRLLDEVEQIMTEGDIDIQRNREQLKAIRRGEWTEEQIIEHFERKEKELSSLYTSSKLPHRPDETKIKTILNNCLEEHFGDLGNASLIKGSVESLIFEIEHVLTKYKEG